MYWAIENIHMQTTSQNAPGSYFKSLNFILSGSVYEELNYESVYSLILRYLSALSALLSI